MFRHLSILPYTLSASHVGHPQFCSDDLLIINSPEEDHLFSIKNNDARMDPLLSPRRQIFVSKKLQIMS
jgi:hypothetical protein